MIRIDRQFVAEHLPRALATDFSCMPEDFVREKTVIVKARNLPGRRRFPFRKPALSMVTMGRGTVIAADETRLAWARANLGDVARDALFSSGTLALVEALVRPDGQYLAGPDLKYLCTEETVVDPPVPDRTRVEVVPGPDVAELRALPGFANALGYHRDGSRPDVCAAVARIGNDIAGVAAVTADSDLLWQVGVDVLPAHQGIGIAGAIVAAATQEILRQGAIPYYSTAVGNVRSSNVAQRVGYRLAWTEVYVRGPSM